MGVRISCEVCEPSALVCMHAVLYWEDIVKMCISSLSPVDCYVDFVSFLCASVRGDGMKHVFCKDLAGLVPAVAAEWNVRLNLQQLMKSLGIIFKQ